MAPRTYRVLVADSHLDARERTLRALAAGGFDCASAGDGELALALLGSDSFDVLVTELVLPKLHGHSLIVRTQQRREPPRIVVLTDLHDPRLIRDLLARGVDDYLPKSVPGELLCTKLLSLFELDKWRAGQQIANAACQDVDRESLLVGIERQLQVITTQFADKLAPLFEAENPKAELPPAITTFAKRLAMEEHAESAASLASAADVRAAARVEIRATAIAIQVNEQFDAIDTPVRVILRDVSAKGVRLMHTRAIPAADLVLEWQAETMPYFSLRVPLQVTHCRPVGRFYDIGGRLAVPADQPIAND